MSLGTLASIAITLPLGMTLVVAVAKGWRVTWAAPAEVRLPAGVSPAGG